MAMVEMFINITIRTAKKYPFDLQPALIRISNEGHFVRLKITPLLDIFALHESLHSVKLALRERLKRVQASQPY